MESHSQIIAGVSKMVPVKTKRKETISKKQLDIFSEFQTFKEVFQRKRRLVYEYRVFTWSKPNLVELQLSEKTVSKKICREHSITNMPTHIVVVKNLKSFVHKMNEDSTLGAPTSQKESQEIILYELSKEQIENIAKTINNKQRSNKNN